MTASVVKQEEYKEEEEDAKESQSLYQRITAVAASVDGFGMGLYSLVAAVLPEASSGPGAWKDAINRNDRLPEVNRQAVPSGIYLGKIHGNRKQTHIVPFEQAPSVVKFVMKNPMDFFGDDEAHDAMVMLAGREATASVVAALAAAEAERTEAQMCLLPALVASSSASSTAAAVTAAAPSRFRISQKCHSAAEGSGRYLLGSIRDFIAWLGLDRNNTWCNWLEEAFKSEMNLVMLEYVTLPGERSPTPMTNYAGFCLILRLCAGRSTISDAMIDEATTMLGRVKVGDSRLHAEIEQNAAAASAEDRAFVLGEVCDSVPNNSGGHSYDNSGISESSSLPNLLAVSRGIKRRKTSTTGIQKWGESVISIQGTLKLWGVHHAVLKAYTSDVANAMLAIKSKQRNGEFFDVRLWGPLYKAHKYIPSDEPLLREAVDKTRELLKKRILDLRRDLAHNARIADTIGKK